MKKLKDVFKKPEVKDEERKEKEEKKDAPVKIDPSIPEKKQRHLR